MIQKIREEIERRREAYLDYYDRHGRDADLIAATEDLRLLEVLDTLELAEQTNKVLMGSPIKSDSLNLDALEEKSEKPTFLESEVEKWMQDNSDDNGFFNQVELARHFAQWGAEHLKK